MSDEHTCVQCHRAYSLREGAESTPLCDGCAHGAVLEFAELVRFCAHNHRACMSTSLPQRLTKLAEEILRWEAE